LAKVVWTVEAEQRLRRIHDYIAPDKPAAAFGVIESLYRRAEILTQFPEIGHVHRTPSGREVRILLWGHTGSFTCTERRTTSTSWASSTGRWS
jgi:toxin ParE1/3/4